MRRLQTLVRLALAAAWAAWIGAVRTPARDLQFGITPVLGAAAMHEDFDPLAEYLTNVLGCRVVLYVAADYGDLRVQMERGAVDIGSFSPFAYVDAARGGRIRILVQSLIRGSASYRGIIVVRGDSGLERISDLRGKRFAFVDRKSASGYVYPRALLVRMGLDPDRYFGAVVFAGDHNRVIQSVLDGASDGGATYDDALRVAASSGVRVGDLKVIARTDLIPHDAIAVRSDLDPRLARQLKAALIAMTQTDDGRRIFAESRKGLSGFAAASDSAFDSVRAVARTAGL